MIVFDFRPYNYEFVPSEAVLQAESGISRAVRHRIGIVHAQKFPD